MGTHAAPVSQSETINYKVYSNQALENLKNSSLGDARISIERALFKNPFSKKSHQIQRTILDKLSDKNYAVYTEIIPAYLYYIDWVPDFLFLILFCVAVYFFMLKFTALIRQERSQFKRLPELRAQSLFYFIPLLIISSFFSLKIYSNSSPYACLKEETKVYSGPSTDFSLISSLPEGSCVAVEKMTPSWISISSNKKSSGWTMRSSLEIVRGEGI